MGKSSPSDVSLLFHIADERNSDVKIACLSTLSTVHYCSYD